jgi:hypothetical protein
VRPRFRTPCHRQIRSFGDARIAAVECDGYGGWIVEDDADLPDAGERSGLQVGAAYPCGCVVDDDEFGVAVLV